MPIYEYQCDNCGKVVEVLATSVHDDTPPHGCTCGNGSHFSRLYSTFAAHSDSGPEPQIASCGREECCEGCAMRDGH